MAFEKITDLSVTPAYGAIKRREISLWVLPGATSVEITSLVGLPWVNIWDASPEFDVSNLWESVDNSRRPFKVDRPEQDHNNFPVSEFVRIYDVKQRETDGLKQKRSIDRLKDRIEESNGLLCFVGRAQKNWDDIHLAQELADGMDIVVLDAEEAAGLSDDCPKILLWWDKGAESFANACKAMIDLGDAPEIVDLKDAPGIRLNSQLLEDVSKYWTFIGKAIGTPPAAINQEAFDAFLNGDHDSWTAYSMRAPYRRRVACEKKPKKPNELAKEPKKVDFIDEVLERARRLEREHLEPTEQFRQILIFCEPGSGITTLLRQLAIKLAEQGFPTLLSKPFPKSFGGRSLENFIIDAQDQWLCYQQDQGNKTGMLPCCLLVDADGETTSGDQGLSRSLQALGRKILLVRALEQPREEIEKKTGTDIYALRSEVQEGELVKLGAHLKAFCEKNALASIPGEDEWHAFHEGLASLGKHSSGMQGDEAISTAPPFLIGIYPFVKERISDNNSLEQYYYRKWAALDSDDLKEIVRILAVAGIYGLSVPLDILRRHPVLDTSVLHAGADKETKRIVDIFVGWSRQGHLTRNNWCLHMRHAVIGLFLSRMIDPSEGDFPFSALLPLLKSLSTKEEDLWFAGTLAYRLGRRFTHYSPPFTLETDTTIQRAARAIFNGIPDFVKESSRTIRHHQGRYHIHVLRACIHALENPEQTTLARDDVVDIARGEFNQAKKLLEMASEIRDEGEPISNVFNTLAMAHFELAEMLGTSSDEGKDKFKEALNHQERAIKNDPSNGHALSQYIDRIIKSIPSLDAMDSDREEALDRLANAESRLIELIKLHEENRWRNIESVEAEKQLGRLVQDQVEAVEKLLGKESVPAIEFSARNPEAILFLEVRKICGGRRLGEVFEIPGLVGQLREKRDRLLELQNRSSRGDSFLYRLFLEDREGRLEFKIRLEILGELKRKDPEQFLPFRQDEAALYCQLDQLDVGFGKFEELRQYRTNNRTQWFWFNERALIEIDADGKGVKVDGKVRSRKMTLEVINAVSGRSRIRGTEIKVKYQPHQQIKDNMKKRELFTAYIRFTLNGLQAVPKKLIQSDMQEMGLS
uniref:Uncharacterized protein n=1 Tax=Candidatus Kentrum sp. TUN TaxID=2126343 RepID=A0A450ZNK1_9GAMM|nr:MAG: hypothetical protein BECKTUN1418D_GA0071000_10328 [Candidatus Kentron sp. TUN]